MLTPTMLQAKANILKSFSCSALIILLTSFRIEHHTQWRRRLSSLTVTTDAASVSAPWSQGGTAASQCLTSVSPWAFDGSVSPLINWQMPRSQLGRPSAHQWCRVCLMCESANVRNGPVKNAKLNSLAKGLRLGYGVISTFYFSAMRATLATTRRS